MSWCFWRSRHGGNTSRNPSETLVRTKVEEYGGRFREQQNWISGSAYNPCSAAFVPPPPELVEGLIDDLVEDDLVLRFSAILPAPKTSRFEGAAKPTVI
jgi:hypothetical protein